MDEARQSAGAWQPLTFGGVAAYGTAWVGPLLLTTILVAALAGGTVAFVLKQTWAPVFAAAIQNLPPGTRLQGGRLNAAGPARLAENPFLALGLDPSGGALPPATADFELLLTRDDWRVRSLFGTVAIPYPPQRALALDRAML